MDRIEFSDDKHIQREILSRTLSGHLYSVKRISVSKNGKFIATGSFDGTVRLWDAQDNYEQTQILFFLPEMIEGLVVSSDSRFIVAGSENSTIFCHDLTNNITRQLIPDEGASWRSGSLIVSPVANVIALIDYEDQIKIIDLEKGENGEIITSFNMTRNLGSNESMRFSSNGQELFLGLINGEVIGVNWKTGEEIGSIKAHEGSTLCLELNDGGMLVTGGMDQSVKLWKDGNLINVIPCETDPLSIEFYQDIVVAGTERETVTFNINNDNSTVRIKHQISSSNVGLTMDKSSIIRGMGENEIRIWNTAGKHLKTLLGRSETVNKAIVSKDNRSMITASNDRAVHVIDLVSGEDIEILRGHDEAVTALCISPDGAHLVSSGFDDKLMSWFTTKWQEERVLMQAVDMVSAMEFAPDGSQLILACSGDNSVRLMDFTTANIMKTLYGHEDYLNKVIIDPSSYLVYSASDDGSVRCWNFTDESCRIVLDNGEEGSVLALTLAEGRKWIAAGGKNETVQIIDLTTFNTVKEYKFDSMITSLDFNSGENQLLVGTKFIVYIIDIDKDKVTKVGTHLEIISSVYWLKGKTDAFVSISNSKEIFKYRLLEGSFKGSEIETVPAIEIETQPEVVKTEEISEEEGISTPIEVEEEEQVTLEDESIPTINAVAIKELIDDLDYSIEGMMEFWGSIIEAGVEEELIGNHFENVKQEMLQVKYKLLDIYQDHAKESEVTIDTGIDGGSIIDKSEKEDKESDKKKDSDSKVQFKF